MEETLPKSPVRGRPRAEWVPTHPGSSGFTLVETSIVLTLIAILLTIGVSGIRMALAREEIDGWVRSVAYDLAAGKQAAITRRASVTATLQNQTFTIAVSGGGNLRQDTVPSHITFGSTLRSLTFDRRGVPSGDLSLTVTSTTSGRSYTITIEAGTGRVTYSEP
ncbi:MAG: prepilin-type N-terminal cleavage/methylation domain-containing protein [Armatimonadota bacterium]